MTAAVEVAAPPSVRTLDRGDVSAVAALIGAHPLHRCMAAATAEGALLGGSPGTRVLGALRTEPGAGPRLRLRDGWLHSALVLGANAMPVATTPESRAVLAQAATGMGAGVSSVVGPREEVLDLWRHLAPGWRPAREVRSCQPLLALAGPPRTVPDPRVRLVRVEEVDLLVPAATAMFLEEVGVPPSTPSTAAAYRARLAQTVRAGWAFARVDGDRIVFKAEVGALSHGVCQVQGVWVAPDQRGRGLGTAAMAAVVAACQARIAPVVSLYVNDFNVAARALYQRVGFTAVGEFATVLR